MSQEQLLLRLTAETAVHGMALTLLYQLLAERQPELARDWLAGLQWHQRHQRACDPGSLERAALTDLLQEWRAPLVPD